MPYGRVVGVRGALDFQKQKNVGDGPPGRETRHTDGLRSCSPHGLAQVAHDQPAHLGLMVLAYAQEGARGDDAAGVAHGLAQDLPPVASIEGQGFFEAGADDVRPGTRAELVRGGIGGTHAHQGKIPAIANAQRLLHPARAAQDLARIAVLVPLFFVRRVERRPGGPGDGVALQVESVLGGGAHDTGQAPHDGAGVFALPGQGGQALHKLVVVDVYFYADHGYPCVTEIFRGLLLVRVRIDNVHFSSQGERWYPSSSLGGSSQRIPSVCVR